MKTSGWIFWIKILAGIALLVVLYNKIDSRESVLKAFAKLSPSYILLCFALFFANIGLAYLRWRYLLKRRFPDLPNWDIFGSLMFGYSLGLLTPGSLGEMGRGLFFANRDRVAITGLNVLDKLASQIVLMSIGWSSIMIMMADGTLLGEFNATAILIPGTIVLLILWVVVLNPPRLRKWIHLWAMKKGTASRLHSIAYALDGLKTRDSMVMMAISLVWVFVIYFQYHVLIAIFTDLSIKSSLLSASATQFTKTFIPITFGELGVREGIAIFFYQHFGVSEGAVFNGSLLIFFFNFLIPSLTGLYFLFQIRERRNGKGEPKEPERNESL